MATVDGMLECCVAPYHPTLSGHNLARSLFAGAHSQWLEERGHRTQGTDAHAETLLHSWVLEALILSPACKWSRSLALKEGRVTLFPPAYRLRLTEQELAADPRVFYPLPWEVAPLPWEVES